jgi:hypothetical protein
MDRLRLRAILDAYGADPQRWPEAERAAALRLLETSSDLESVRDDALRLDRLIAAAPAGEVTQALLARILETAPHPVVKVQRQRRASPWRFMPSLTGLGRLPPLGGGVLTRPAAILMLAVGVGLGAGALMPITVDAAAPSDVQMLSAMWGSSVLTQDGANW